MRAARLLSFVVASLPAAALACPACARDGNSTSVAWMLAAMMLAPLGLGAVILAVARAGEREP